MTNLRDTEDGINEAGWEAEMARTTCGKRTHGGQVCGYEPEHDGICGPVDDGPCDRCKKTAQLIDYCDTLDPSDTESLCRNCFEKKTGTGAYDPENRDWDAVRDEQDGF